MQLLCKPPLCTKAGRVQYLRRSHMRQARPRMCSCPTQRTACGRSSVRLPARTSCCTLQTRRAVHKGRRAGGNTALLRHGGECGWLRQSRAAWKTAECRRRRKQTAHQCSQSRPEMRLPISMQAAGRVLMPARQFSPAQTAAPQSSQQSARTARLLMKRRRQSRSMGQQGSTASPQP